MMCLLMSILITLQDGLVPVPIPTSVCGFHQSYLSSRKTQVLSLSSPERLCLPSIVSASVLDSVVTGAFQDRRLKK